MDNKLEVSIICTAFNHEKYIAKCLDGFLMQKTDFLFEVLVNDDCSTDNTAGIIKEYAEKYPEIIKPVFQVENQYSKGVYAVSDILLPLSKGKYIALCEGDDYWTDPNKLQKQFELMEQHSEVDICAHAAYKVDSDTEEIICKISPSDESRILTVKEVISGNGGYVATNSLFFRNSICKNLPEFCVKYPYDYAFQMLGSFRGGMLYMEDVMSCYRYMSKSSWSAAVVHNREKSLKVHLDFIDMLNMVDKYTDQKYTKEIEKIKLEYEFIVVWSKGDFKALLQKKFSANFKKLPLMAKLKIYLRVIFPFLDSAYKGR